MGGDSAPEEILKGAKLAIDEYPINIILTGPKETIQNHLDRLNISSDQLSIEDAPDIISMNDSPSSSYRAKKNSSIRVGLELVKAGRADGFISAGNTGAVMTASLLTFGRIKQIERPAIATTLPSQTGQFIMTDLGSNVDCKPSHLVQFAIMGHFFAQIHLNVNDPKVALLNIGEEPEKGNQLTQSTYPLLKEAPINFTGNIEGKEVLKGVADVVVCDGFTGNSLLKFGEGVSEVFFNFFKKEAKRSLISLLGLLLLKGALKKFRRRYDHAEYGGALLLGVKGVSVIAHGSSCQTAIKNAIHTAIEGVEGKIIEKIEHAFES